MMHKMYPDGGRKLARTGMRNKLFILHGLIIKKTKFNMDVNNLNTIEHYLVMLVKKKSE